jgi:UDP-N-acetylglucosamine 2-epimerase (non-hydrolysing)
VVGNTIVEVVRTHMPQGTKQRNYLVADIHRNESLSDARQFDHVLRYVENVGAKLGMPVKLVRFNRALRMIKKCSLLRDKPHLQLVGPLGFLEYLTLQYNAYGVISDSGTSQEECPLLRVPVAVPRNFTERPESVKNGNSILVGETRPIRTMVDETLAYFKAYTISPQRTRWLGDGKTSQRIINILEREL